MGPANAEPVERSARPPGLIPGPESLCRSRRPWIQPTAPEPINDAFDEAIIAPIA